MRSPVVASTAGLSANGAIVVPFGPDPATGVTVTVHAAALPFFTRRNACPPAGMVSPPALAADRVAAAPPPVREQTTGVSAAMLCAPYAGANTRSACTWNR